MSIPKDRSWFWAPEWQATEREAEEDIIHGRMTEFASLDELIDDPNS